MKNYKTLIVALIGITVLSFSAFGIEISVSSNAGGFTEVIDAGFDDRVSGSTIIGSDRLSNSIQGNANLNESHSVSNKAGATAEVGVDIRNAEWYSYSYDLWPGKGSSWKASKYPQVAAGEDLDVLNASYIEAYASATSPQGYNAGVSTVISDPGNEASLTGYSNLAMASKNEAFASQTADWASSPNGYIQAEASADFTQLKPKPLRFREDNAEESMRVDRGSIEGYSDLASASAQGIMATQQVSLATGEDIQTRSEASFQTASLFQSLKTERAKVNTLAVGSLTGYNASAKSFDGNVQASQTGHIIGSFSSTAIAGSDRKTRSSNYGTVYDFDMQAKKSTSGSYATGSLGYYVDNVSTAANRIQGAVDASVSGDAINVAPGIYFENVQIDKSLNVVGAGASDTIVDGQQAGSVFIIGKNDPNVDVSLSRLSIQGGSGTYTERWIGEPLVQCGGGIWNAGSLSLTDIMLSGNSASGYGAGIWNVGNLTVDRSLIYGNEMPGDGGGIWNSGELTVVDSTVAGNSAYWNGGGIWNSGNMRVERSNVTGNMAYYYGGGIANDMGQATVLESTISGNTGVLGGGGIYNILGQVTIDNNTISGNSGNGGGGVLNNGDMTILGGSVSGNNAAKGGGIFNMGTLELNGTLADNNTATEEGGGIYNEGYGTVNLDDNSSISNNTATSGGGIYNKGYSTVNLNNNSHISGNTAARGGGIYSYDNSRVNLHNSSYISENDAYEGGGIYSYAESMVNLNHNSSVSNNAAYRGGGIYSDNYGTVNLNHNSHVTNNAAYDGGGIYSYAESTVNLNDSSYVSDNTADYGAGIYNWRSTANLNHNSSINDNAAYRGGGIYSINYGTVNLNNNSHVSDNIADYGAGVYSYEYGTVNLNDNSHLNYNTAEKGGGIFNYFNSAVNLNDDSYISGNTAYDGGGIYNYYYGIVNLYNGSIDHNNATSPAPSGGGIYNLGSIYGDTSIVHDNTPDQIVNDVDWLPEI